MGAGIRRHPCEALVALENNAGWGHFVAVGKYPAGRGIAGVGNMI